MFGSLAHKSTWMLAMVIFQLSGMFRKEMDIKVSLCLVLEVLQCRIADLLVDLLSSDKWE